jgi:thiamine-monophosphate kinase
VNLSDVAAMGARPRAALLSLALPETLGVDALDGLVDGVVALAARHRVAVVGGNITRSPGPLMVDVTATGSVGRRQILRRSGARPGDEVYVTGVVGDAAAGLRLLRERADASGPGVDRYLRPEPRVRAGWLLGGNRAATACIDLSDGLADGVRQVAAASGVGVAIDAGAVPLSDDARGVLARLGGDPLRAAVTGGDDYELLFTVSPKHRGRLRSVRRALGDLPITRIGVVTKDPAVLLGGDEMPGGYEHFGGPEGPQLRTSLPNA